MWIVPQNILSEYSVCVPGMEVSTLVYPQDCEQLAEQCASALAWRSKRSLVRTWWQRWRKVSWIHLLSGRILKPSMEDPFAAWWTSSRAAIPASPSLVPDGARDVTTPDTFGRIYASTLIQSDLFGASSKTLISTYPWDSERFSTAYKIWATGLKRDSLRRQKSAHRTAANGSSYWPTMSVEGNYNRKEYPTAGGDGLATAARQWPTPIVPNGGRKPARPMTITGQTEDGKRQVDLNHAVRALFPTPSARDYRSGKASSETMSRNSRPLNETLISGPPPTAASSTPGSHPELWATPCVKDKDNQQTKYAQGGNPLPRQVNQVSARPTPHATAGTGPGTQGRDGGENLQTRAKGLLNPRWVETLMGIPIGWCDPLAELTNSDS